MSYAYVAALATNNFCQVRFNDVSMASTWFNGSWADAFDHTGYGTHKYIAADRLTEELGMTKGAGVYGYWGMKDGSILLLTCRGPVAYWSGKADETAKWSEGTWEPMPVIT